MKVTLTKAKEILAGKDVRVTEEVRVKGGLRINYVTPVTIVIKKGKKKHNKVVIRAKTLTIGSKDLRR